MAGNVRFVPHDQAAFIRVVIIGAKAVMLVAVVWGAAGLIVSTVMLLLPVSPENGVKCTGNCTVQ